MSPAETLPFSANSVQLVTASQSCHWFDLPAFYKEVDRILVPGKKILEYNAKFLNDFIQKVIFIANQLLYYLFIYLYF